MTENPYATPHNPAPPYRRLARPRTDRMLAGVLAGFARYFGIDVTALRVIFAVGVLLSWGALLLAYPIAWLLMPEDPAPPATWPTTTAPGPPPAA
jgi:phage shock protein PspC (stress-responsive transcriptional regulator)